MGILINTSDFLTGKFKISQGVHTDLDSYIARYEEKYIVELLGFDLTQLFVNDLVSSIPTSAKYLAIYNPFYQDFNKKIVQSSGMKDMLLGFIYFEYNRDFLFKNTLTGIIKSTNEAGQLVSNPEVWMYDYYNESVLTYTAIQWYIEQNKGDYESFNGQCKEFYHWSN